MKKAQKSIESEAKFLLKDPAKQIPVLLQYLKKKGLKIGDPAQGVQVDHYFDTGDWDLYNAGWSYRFRDASPLEQSVGLKSLSISGNRINKRLHKRKELELVVDALPEKTELPISEAPLNKELEEFVKHGAASLIEVFRICTERVTYRLSVKGADILLCVDDTTVEVDQDNGSPHPKHFYELELELEGGKEKQLRQLANGVEKKLNLRVSQLSKFERGLQAAGLLPSISLPDDAGNKDLMGPEAPVAKVVQAFFQCHFRSFLRYEESAMEGIDPEGVHQLRVASRRLRVGMDVFSDYMPERISKALRTELQWITKMLGEVRDLDVFTEAVTRDAAEAEVEIPEFRAYLAESRTAARSSLVKSLTSGRVQRFRRDFADFLSSDIWTDEIGNGSSVLELAREVLLPELTQVRKDGAGIDASSLDEELHQLRLDGKSLRYRLELFAPIVPGELKALIKPSKALQDYLGDHQDACVALDRIDNFRKSNKLQDAEKGELKKLRKMINCRRRQLREVYAEKWNNFSSRARCKKLRKLLKARVSPEHVTPDKTAGSPPTKKEYFIT